MSVDDTVRTEILKGTIRSCDALRGTMSASAALSAQMQPSAAFAGWIAAEASLIGEIAAAQGDTAPLYDGEYAVEPKLFEDVTLPTKDRKMKSDVTVSKIPMYEVSNEAGGLTLIIGGN